MFEVDDAQDLDHVNFFDETVYEGPGTPNDDNNLNAQLYNDGSNSSQPSSLTIDFIKDDLGHPQGFNGSASENEMVATSESDSALFNGDVADISDKEHHWIEAMKALYDNDTWEITELPSDRKAIRSKWVLKIKYKSSGEIERYKARLFAIGFNQKEGIDFDETFSLIVKIVT
nr:putative reverse transcriptase, RNA-dependent DNA polymerase, Gag-polypeptide of LTR copia-type [Tanacetum cinerariifolium]